MTESELKNRLKAMSDPELRSEYRNAKRAENLFNGVSERIAALCEKEGRNRGINFRLYAA